MVSPKEVIEKLSIEAKERFGGLKNRKRHRKGEKVR
jgi:hypothetical protein